METHRVEVLCDFDGTISNEDIGFKIIETFAGPGWLEIEEAYQRGEKGSREALEEIFALTRVSEQELRRFVEENFFVDPAFADFLDYCSRMNWPVTILSDGFDFYIDLLLNKHRLNVPYLANELRVADMVLKANFPYTSSHCGLCGNCKLDYARQLREKGARIIYIGDGHSDTCAGQVADLLFAKGALARYCQKENIPFVPYRSFHDILAALREGLPVFLR